MSAPQVHRGYIYLVDYDPAPGQGQGKKRPALVVQNDTGNAAGGTTIVVSLSSQIPSRLYPFHVALPAEVLGRAGIVMCEQVRTVSIERVEMPALAECPAETMAQVEEAMSHSLGLSPESSVAPLPR